MRSINIAKMPDIVLDEFCCDREGWPLSFRGCPPDILSNLSQPLPQSSDRFPTKNFTNRCNPLLIIQDREINSNIEGLRADRNDSLPLASGKPSLTQN